MIAVSPQGDDSAAGSPDAPFRSLERTQLAVRQVNTEHDVTVELKDGIYRLERPLLFAARERLKALPAPVRLDLSAGSDADVTEDVVAFAKLLDEIKPAGLDYRSTIYPGENHNSVRLVSFPRGLYWVYRSAGKP